MKVVNLPVPLWGNIRYAAVIDFPKAKQRSRMSFSYEREKWCRENIKRDDLAKKVSIYTSRIFHYFEEKSAFDAFLVANEGLVSEVHILPDIPLKDNERARPPFFKKFPYRLVIETKNKAEREEVDAWFKKSTFSHDITHRTHYSYDGGTFKYTKNLKRVLYCMSEDQVIEAQMSCPITDFYVEIAVVN